MLTPQGTPVKSEQHRPSDQPWGTLARTARGGGETLPARALRVGSMKDGSRVTPRAMRAGEGLLHF